MWIEHHTVWHKIPVHRILNVLLSFNLCAPSDKRKITLFIKLWSISIFETLLWSCNTEPFLQLNCLTCNVFLRMLRRTHTTVMVYFYCFQIFGTSKRRMAHFGCDIDNINCSWDETFHLPSKTVIPQWGFNVQLFMALKSSIFQVFLFAKLDSVID